MAKITKENGRMTLVEGQLGPSTIMGMDRDYRLSVGGEDDRVTVRLDETEAYALYRGLQSALGMSKW